MDMKIINWKIITEPELKTKLELVRPKFSKWRLIGNEWGIEKPSESKYGPLKMSNCQNFARVFMKVYSFAVTVTEIKLNANINWIYLTKPHKKSCWSPLLVVVIECNMTKKMRTEAWTKIPSTYAETSELSSSPRCGGMSCGPVFEAMKPTGLSWSWLIKT